MAKKERRVIAQSFGITLPHKRMLQSVMDKYGFLSESEAVRLAITELYQKAFPDYIYNKSAKDVEKRKAMLSAEELDAMTDKEFVEQFIEENPVYVWNQDRTAEYLLLHGYANMIHPVKITEVRKFFEKDQDILSIHKQKIASRPITGEFFPAMVNYLQKHYNIVVDEQEKKSNQ